jgi:hypothetical protein
LGYTELIHYIANATFPIRIEIFRFENLALKNKKLSGFLKNSTTPTGIMRSIEDIFADILE